VSVWRGESHHEYGEGAVIGTLAIALKLLGEADTQSQAQALAQTLWDERDRKRY